MKFIWLENFRHNVMPIEYVSVQKWTEMQEMDKLSFLASMLQR